MAEAGVLKSEAAFSDKKVKPRRFNNKMIISREDMEIVSTLEQLKSNLGYLHNNLDYVTDPILIDGYIYEIKAVHMKYQYYLKLCKERGIIGKAY